MHGAASSDRLAQESAVDSDVAAGDETAGVVTGEEHRRADEFPRLAESAHGRVTPNGLRPSGGGTVVVEQQLAILFGGKKARCDGIHADAFGGPFASEELREIEHGRFGRGIGDHARERQMTRRHWRC